MQYSVLITQPNIDIPYSREIYQLLICGERVIQFNKVNIMVADALAPCVARSSAPMMLTMQNR